MITSIIKIKGYEGLHVSNDITVISVVCYEKAIQLLENVHSVVFPVKNKFLNQMHSHTSQLHSCENLKALSTSKLLIYI